MVRVLSTRRVRGALAAGCEVLQVVLVRTVWTV